MKKVLHIVLPILLFGAQTDLVVYWDSNLGQHLNPVIIFLISIAIAFYYLKTLFTTYNPFPVKIINSKSIRLLYAVVGFGSIAVCFPALKKLFTKYIAYGTYSDVLPQLQTQYDRFVHGIFPYQDVPFVGYNAYPVYMPLHWLPLAIPTMLHKDIRWVGILFLAITACLYAYFVSKNRASVFLNSVIILLPSLCLWAYILPSSIDMPVSLETVIAAYYFVLAAGLLSRNLVITTIGIILCLLSRYTMIFWLPIFAILLWQNRTLRINAIVWSSIIAAFTLFYLIPFCFKDPSILSKGIKYHNDCAELGWTRPWAFYDGLTFSIYMNDFFRGTIQHKVFLARTVQASTMLLLLISGIVLYRRWKSKINFYDFAFLWLYLYLLFFFMFGPMTFRYYWLSLLIISATMCGKIILLRAGNKESVAN